MSTHQLSGKILSYIVSISYTFIALFLFNVQSRGNQVRLLVPITFTQISVSVLFLESLLVLVSESKTLLQVIIWIHIFEKILIISTSLSSGATSDQQKNSMHILTASIYYMVAKVNGFVLLDVDMLPLQGEHWQTDQMLSAYFSLLASRFSTPLSLKFNLDFTSVGSIITGTGVELFGDRFHTSFVICKYAPTSVQFCTWMPCSN